MKMYNKPQLYLENFEVSEHIALGCTIADRDASGKTDNWVTYNSKRYRIFDHNYIFDGCTIRKTESGKTQTCVLGDNEVGWVTVTDGSLFTS